MSIRSMPIRPASGFRYYVRAGELKAARQLLHLGLGVGVDLGPRVVERRDDQILQHLGLGRVDDRFVDFQACDSALECHRDHLRLDDYYAQVLSLTEPPAETFERMNAVYKAYFKEPRPTRTTVVVAKLVGQGHIEITATARK